MNYPVWTALALLNGGPALVNVFRHNGRATVEVLSRMKQ
jgi:hypothetical protein